MNNDYIVSLFFYNISKFPLSVHSCAGLIIAFVHVYVQFVACAFDASLFGRKRLGVHAERLRVAGSCAFARPPEARRVCVCVEGRIGVRNLEIAKRYGMDGKQSEACGEPLILCIFV